ncbi:17-beta-hydroxysteroid dehydrogenase type 3 isoform X2 [Hemibagrus wyckioides]|uniref:17-beta-hydroxysteroid dehydrogenase type 3 isoform X2 n=1 Tax=Hemibagrus wyckioides TaxID=337641 RepID=UPI00266B4A21|nr:17-beta-hydroxysteroid dehydrogenase type 3 isoform X2 [Hemibagrus wyckioides]
MALIEFIFVLCGACVVFFWLTRAIMMLAPMIGGPIPGSFFTSMGKWAVITGGSEGIGKAYAEEFARLGLNVVIISRNKEKLARAAKDIEVKTNRKVMVISTDFTKDDIYESIKENIQDLDIAVLVNNVGILPSKVPSKLLETVHLEEKIHQMINCNMKATVKMCHIVLPGMVERGRGIILNISSGISKSPFPMYTLYAATKCVSPLGVSTAMTGYQKPSFITLTPEGFVRSSLLYLKAGDQTYGSINHAILGWIMHSIPTWVLKKEAFQSSFQDYVQKQVSGV